jgi:ELWxxDGT repeat protein
MKARTLLIAMCVAGATLATGVLPAAAADPVPYMVRNIKPGSASSNPRELTAIGNLLYFSAGDGAHGRELWRSDGTKAGTYMVADIAKGSASSTPVGMTLLHGLVYFSAADRTHGRELWVTDGTSTGTHQVMDIRWGKKSSDPQELTVAGSYIYFSADDGGGRELWRTDGTTTELIVALGTNSGSNPRWLTEYKGRLYFRAGSGPFYIPENVSSASATATLVNDSQGRQILGAYSLTVSGGVLYFLGWTNGVGPNLYKTTGTQASTKAISPALDTLDLTNVDGTLFFTSLTSDDSGDLWRSNGTKASTFPIAPVGWSSSLTAVGSQLYFTSLGTDGMQSLVTSDGTADGTNSWSASNTNNGAYIGSLVDYGGLLFYAEAGFLMYDTCPTTCSEYSWSHRVVQDYESSSAGDNTLTVVGDTLFYVARDWNNTKGYELWAYKR